EICARCSPAWGRRNRKSAPSVVLLQLWRRARDMPASRLPSRHDLAKFKVERCRSQRANSAPARTDHAVRANSNNITQGRFQEMRIMKWAGRGWACAVLMAASAFAAAPASAQELSEKATRTFMEYAWTLTPERFTKPNGEAIL